MGYTQPTKADDIERKWHRVDVAGKILGREATKIARLLMGKGKPRFVRHLDMGDYVVVLNAKDVRVTGDKEDKKKYKRYSGYPSGLKEEKLSSLRKKKPEEIVHRAVAGMLPKNKLRKRILRRLYVYSGEDHPYRGKF